MYIKNSPTKKKTRPVPNVSIKEVEECRKHYDAYAVPDHQSVFVEGITGVIPCALIKKITREGGGRKFKGAFQVNLDYFVNCPDRDLLWQAVYTTTIETLKKRRHDVYGNGLQKVIGSMKKKIKGMFR